MRFTLGLLAGCLTTAAVAATGGAYALERVAATPYGGSAAAVHVPTCATGEVITGRDGRLVCTPVADSQPTCGLAVRTMTCSMYQPPATGDGNSVMYNRFDWVSMLPCNGHNLTTPLNAVGPVAIECGGMTNPQPSCPSGYTIHYGDTIPVVASYGGGSAGPSPFTAWCVKN